MTSERDDLLDEALGSRVERLPDVDEGSSSGDGFSDTILEETFGSGANEKVLLVMEGVSLRKIVESSK